MSIKDYFNKKIAVYRLSDSGDATRPYAISFGNTGTIDSHIQRIEDGDTLDTYGVQGALWKAWVDVDTDIKEGDEILIIKDEGRIILKKADRISEEMKDDLEFAKRTEKAWQSYEKGEFISQPVDKFLEELENVKG